MRELQSVLADKYWQVSIAIVGGLLALLFAAFWAWAGAVQSTGADLAGTMRAISAQISDYQRTAEGRLSRLEERSDYLLKCCDVLSHRPGPTSAGRAQP